MTEREANTSFSFRLTIIIEFGIRNQARVILNDCYGARGGEYKFKLRGSNS